MSALQDSALSATYLAFLSETVYTIDSLIFYCLLKCTLGQLNARIDRL